MTTQTTETTKRDLHIKTPDGVAPAWAYRPEGSEKTTLPAVLYYPDGLGVRPALHAMAARLASTGYVVVMPNLFYRNPEYVPPADISGVWGIPEMRTKIMGLIHGLTFDKSMPDAGAYLDAIKAEPNVHSDRVGVMGYCMGGRMAFATASHYPDRIGAMASFHGGGLVTDTADSPHLLASKIKSALYFGVADNDASCTPEQQGALATALGNAHLEYQIELYKGKGHGFAVTDHAGVYDEEAGERHWRRTAALFAEHLPSARG